MTLLKTYKYNPKWYKPAVHWNFNGCLRGTALEMIEKDHNDYTKQICKAIVWKWDTIVWTKIDRCKYWDISINNEYFDSEWG